MKRLHQWAIFFTIMIICLANVANPPDGKTGAPGDSFCTECHSSIGATVFGTIEVEGFPASIVPGETYPLTVVSRDTVGNAALTGFQMTVLGPFNTRAGTLSNPSQSSVITFAFGRQYFEHHPAVHFPDSHVVRWNVDWTAPQLPDGSQVTWYVAGNIANGNNMETQDRIVAANGFGRVLLAATDDISSSSSFVLFPNPGKHELWLMPKHGEAQNGEVIFYDRTGASLGKVEMTEGRVSVPDELPSGLYILQMRVPEGLYILKWAKV